MHDGVSPQPENRNTTTWALLGIGCKSHVPPTLLANTVPSLNCQLSTFFLSIPSIVLFSLNLFYGVKVLIETSKKWFLNWTMVAILGCLSSWKAANFLSSPSNMVSLSLSLSLKHTRKKQRDFSKTGQSTNSLTETVERAKHMTCHWGEILIWAPQFLIDGAIY